jgi:GAF domain-containing protein
MPAHAQYRYRIRLRYTRCVGLKATTLRMSEDLWDLLEKEAARQGVSAAHVVRDAVLLRLGQLSAERGDPSAQLTIEQLARGPLEQRGRPKEESHTNSLRKPHRLAAVRATGLLDQPADAALETLTRLCTKLLSVPVALISLVQAEREFFAASCGLPHSSPGDREMQLSHSFCQHVVVSRQPFVVSDAREHPLVRDSRAIRDLGVIAYAGIPLTTRDDEVLGGFCAIDRKPRMWTQANLDVLRDLAGSAIAYIDGRLATPQA